MRSYTAQRTLSSEAVSNCGAVSEKKTTLYNESQQVLMEGADFCHLLITFWQGVPVLKISDPNPIFQIAPLPTNPLCHIAYYNDIHNHILNIHDVNYIHVWFYLCMNIINILIILNQC